MLHQGGVRSRRKPPATLGGQARRKCPGNRGIDSRGSVRRPAGERAARLPGVRVLVTRPEPAAGRLAKAFAGEGAIPVRVPAIVIAPVEDRASAERLRERLSDVAVVVFTSVNAVEGFFDLAPDMSPDGLPPAALAVGRATAERGVARAPGRRCPHAGRPVRQRRTARLSGARCGAGAWPARRDRQGRGVDAGCSRVSCAGAVPRWSRRTSTAGRRRSGWR